jgi:citrate synthase
MDREIVHDGLADISVAETELSHVDGERGRLVLRGHDVERVAASASVEDIAHLLWHGHLPEPAARAEMQSRLYVGRALAFERLPSLTAALDTADAMDALRAATAQLTEHDAPDLPALLCGALPVFAAAHHRLRRNEQPLPPSRERSQAADYLAMLQGSVPSEARVRALDAYLVTVSDHGLNASTFSARVVASTAADSVSAVVAALCALKGPLHGGAPSAVLDMLDAIGTPPRAERWLADALARGERIMGMGHRIYRVRDPRAAVLEGVIRALVDQGQGTARLALARAVEDHAARLLDVQSPNRKLRANVEFNTAVLLEAIGVDRKLLTATFAVGRCVGWLAHVDEQRRKGKLIRPRSTYVGPMP